MTDIDSAIESIGYVVVHHRKKRCYANMTC